jgi:hypothetical protein
MALERLDRTLWSYAEALKHIQIVTIARRTREVASHPPKPQVVHHYWDRPQDPAEVWKAEAENELLVGLRDGDLIVGTGRHLPLSVFGAKQFSYGVRAKVWGRAQTYRSAFVVGRLGGNVFKRTSKARFPIEQLWGPAVPVEMLRDEALAAWEAHRGKVLQEAQRLMALPFSIGLRK